ncbi:hypothetical protein [uncultured Gilvimarinus sp.]|uniref:hypothetical protein n=1 Tax=uncultured Gilvimarinus sp. TaxID=1689143 RepID=UPI0030EF5451|tara:strand:+ start:5730 stop:6125 length:396 start_codon:yes stop_codon:yes gene_type:complete
MAKCTFLCRSDSGEIIQHTEPASESFPEVPGVTVVQSDDGDASWVLSHYHAGGSVLPRPVMAVTQSNAVAVGEPWRIEGIPAGTVVSYPGGTVTVDDGFIELSFAEPGEYKFTLSNFPYIEGECVAKVTAV